MASTAAHRSTGWAVGIIAAAVVFLRVHDPYHAWAIATLLCGYAGGTAPDWLENAWWSRHGGRQLWITHRSWTHWGVAWVTLLTISYLALARTPLAAPAFGFAAGGIMHLLADWPNPLGVPWLLTKRHSLHWWKSGRCDYLIILTMWSVAAATADQVWLHGLLRRRFAVAASSLAAVLPHTHIDVLTSWLHPFS